MSKFIEIDQHLIDLDNISYCNYESTEKSYDDKLHIRFKDGSNITMITNRFNDNSYNKHMEHTKGYNEIKKYLIQENLVENGEVGNAK